MGSSFREPSKPESNESMSSSACAGAGLEDDGPVSSASSSRSFNRSSWLEVSASPRAAGRSAEESSPGGTGGCAGPLAASSPSAWPHMMQNLFSSVFLKPQLEHFTATTSFDP
jgi:hypothetical protein